MSVYIPGKSLYITKQSFVLGKLLAERCPSGKPRGATAAAAGIWGSGMLGLYRDNGKEHGNYFGFRGFRDEGIGFRV